eukprot:gene587-30146_t
MLRWLYLPSLCFAVAAVKGGFVRVSRDTTAPNRNLRWWLLSILPIGGCQALAMGFGTVAYLSLTVAFIQMLKAFTPVITLLVLYYFGVEKPRKMLIMSIVGISLGTFLAVAEETKFDLFGFTIHEISAVAEAMRLVLTQKLLESSAVLLKGISVLRTAALVLFCVTFLGEEVTMRQFVGYIVSLLCFVWYNALRMDATRDVTETPVKRKASSSTRENAYV